MNIQRVLIGDVSLGRGCPLVLMAGPCVIESREHTLMLAAALAQICGELDLPWVFKASFDKANRSSVAGFRGPGMDEGLGILAEVRAEVGVPVLTDVHLPEQAASVGEVVDCVQVPAFLCRQTDLLVAAGRTRKCVNIKKGQFMSPEEMSNVVEKVASTDNRHITLTERGTFFGYNRLVNDMTSLPRMQEFAPVVFDATHSCQLPGGLGTQSGGQRAYARILAKAAIAAGADALFMEVHNDPDHAKSDPATVYPLDRFKPLLEECLRLAEAVR